MGDAEDEALADTRGGILLQNHRLPALLICL